MHKKEETSERKRGGGGVACLFSLFSTRAFSALLRCSVKPIRPRVYADSTAEVAGKEDVCSIVAVLKGNGFAVACLVCVPGRRDYPIHICMSSESAGYTVRGF